jgi:hypothetical protein
MYDSIHPTPEQHIQMLYLAIGDSGMRAEGDTPMGASKAFIEKYPTKRKPFFVTLAQHYKTDQGDEIIYYGASSRRWKNLTKKNLSEANLPNVHIPADTYTQFTEAIKKDYAIFKTYVKMGKG